MLKNINPHLSADILHTLRAMGHGDTIIVADANFPANSVAKHTHVGHALEMQGCNAPEAVAAILSVMPLDTFVDDFAARMQVVDDPDHIPDVQKQAQQAVFGAAGPDKIMVPVERFAFYELAKQSFAVVASNERRFYGCFMLRKGILPPPDGA